jgi:hypothetical protein
MIGPSRDDHTNEHKLTLPLWCFFGDERSPPRGLRLKSEAAPDTATKRSLFRFKVKKKIRASSEEGRVGCAPAWKK